MALRSMVHRPWSDLKQNPLCPLGREGSLVVPPKLTPTKQKSLCDATGMRASVTLFRYVALLRLYPCSITGATELGYLVLHVRPFNSEVHSASALLPCFQTAVNPDRVLG